MRQRNSAPGSLTRNNERRSFAFALCRHRQPIDPAVGPRYAIATFIARDEARGRRRGGRRWDVRDLPFSRDRPTSLTLTYCEGAAGRCRFADKSDKIAPIRVVPDQNAAR
jgi:hypothetical protein